MVTPNDLAAGRRLYDTLPHDPVLPFKHPWDALPPQVQANWARRAREAAEGVERGLGQIAGHASSPLQGGPDALTAPPNAAGPMGTPTATAGADGAHGGAQARVGRLASACGGLDEDLLCGPLELAINELEARGMDVDAIRARGDEITSNFRSEGMKNWPATRATLMKNYAARIEVFEAVGLTPAQILCSLALNEYISSRYGDPVLQTAVKEAIEAQCRPQS